MADTNNAREKEIKVEDLLRLKRAERPDANFWNTFDRELHQRMLQTLVKKDPWYVQVLRAVSGRIAQTTAIGAAAACLALVLVRPAFVDSTESAPDASFARQDVRQGVAASIPTASSALTSRLAAPHEVAMSDLDADLDAGLIRDYQMEAISGLSGSSDLGYTPEYTLDSIETVAYDNAVYVADSASFAGSGLATGLVY
jgi:hypothetical protein